jgi:2-succinyl-5-enolpyruvyl-6-hydroxy-3-cyclohexene-1-carboxylate synthase
MPIRDADQFFNPQQPTGPLFANRGVSGIDGNLATAIGIAQGLKKPTLALIGDLAFLHDLNSLAQLKTCRYPVLFLVFNNQGGGIFSFLPIAKRTIHFEELFATAHPFSFEAAATLFQLPYYNPTTPAEWQHTLSQALTTPTSCLIEIQTDRQENHHLHQEIARHVKQSLSQLSIPTASGALDPLRA